jgi:hypothetical protein
MESALEDPLQSVFSEYDAFQGKIECNPFGSGHIHDTYLVRTASKAAYILQ